MTLKRSEIVGLNNALLRLANVNGSLNAGDQISINLDLLKVFFDAIQEAQKKLFASLTPEELNISPNGQFSMRSERPEIISLIEEYNTYMDSEQEIPELRKINASEMRGDIEGIYVKELKERGVLIF